MSTLLDLDGPTNQTNQSSTNSAASAQRLRTTMAAARVSFTWLGTRKTLNPQQKAQAAETFGAAGEFLSAGKKLLDTRHPAFKAVTAVRGKILSYWKGTSLPYPEPGIRLIRQDQLAELDDRLKDFRDDLTEAVSQLDRRYEELKTAARNRLGTLYNPADYPVSLQGWFKVDWEFPSVEPPSYLRQLNPEIFHQEQARVTARFEEAVRLAEAAFLEEFSGLISHLCERITGEVDGKPKVYRDSVVGNLQEFFERFKSLNVNSHEQLDDLVEQAQRVVRGVAPQVLRDQQDVRQQVAIQLSAVQASLDGLLIDRPRRRIIRDSVPQGGRLMELIVDPDGKLLGVYDELLDLHMLGRLEIRRASHVEPDEHGAWWADLAPCNGPCLGPFALRSLALAAEVSWLRNHLATIQ